MRIPTLTVSFLQRTLDPISYMEAMMDPAFRNGVYDDTNETSEAKERSYNELKEYHKSFYKPRRYDEDSA